MTFDGSPLCCHASTRKGTACQRVPLPGSKYCPSHKHLDEDLEVARPSRNPRRLASTPMILGVDVGGTFTDAALLDRRPAGHRQGADARPTTSPRA